MKRNTLLLISAIVTSSLTLAAQPSVWPPAPSHLSLPVWPGVAPGVTANPPAEVVLPPLNPVAGRPFIRITNISAPTLTLYAPMGKGTGAAIMVFPGGGYRFLSIDMEGTEVCDWLNSAGITCILLKYRVPDSGPYPKSAAALQDAQRALSLVRSHAAEWQIDPNRIGVLGFSAGAYLAAALSTHFNERLYTPLDAADKLSCRPDFAVIVYPGYTVLSDKYFTPNPEINPNAQTPPQFIVQAEDDPVHVENAVAYFMALKTAKVPAELHIYAEGGHGFGLRRTAFPITTWPHTVEIWLHTIKILPAE